MKLFAVGHPAHYIVIGEESICKASASAIARGVQACTLIEHPVWELEGLDAAGDTAVTQWFIATQDGRQAVTEAVARAVVAGRPAMNWTVENHRKCL